MKKKHQHGSLKGSTLTDSISGYEYLLFSKKQLYPIHGPHSRQIANDYVNTYYENSYGFRAEEFTDKTELLALGCSFTYGLGIGDTSQLWHSRVADSLNLTHVNLSRAGASIQWLVDNFYKYVNTYGKPSVLFALFPDPQRIVIPIDGQIWTSSEIKVDPFPRQVLNIDIEHEQNRYFHNTHPSTADQIKIKYQKRPYDVEEVLSEDLAVDQSLRSIAHLESYCEAAGITFLWSTWDSNFASRINKANKYANFVNYFDVNERAGYPTKKEMGPDSKEVIIKDLETYLECSNSHRHQECDCYEKCHNEERSKSTKEFDLGSDTGYNYERVYQAHSGTHTHIHWANAFLQEYEERYGK